jgi:hypothetical protein
MRGAEQFGQTGTEGRGIGCQPSLSGSNWIMKKTVVSQKSFYFVGVPDWI